MTPLLASTDRVSFWPTHVQLCQSTSLFLSHFLLHFKSFLTHILPFFALLALCVSFSFHYHLWIFCPLLYLTSPHLHHIADVFFLLSLIDIFVLILLVSSTDWHSTLLIILSLSFAFNMSSPWKDDTTLEEHINVYMSNKILNVHVDCVGHQKKSDIHFPLQKMYTEHPERNFLTETPNTQTYAQRA